MRVVPAFGEVNTRPDAFAALESGAMKIGRMSADSIETRFYGDTGILIYTADTKMVDGDATVEGLTLSTTVYAGRDSGWHLVSQHQSRID